MRRRNATISNRGSRAPARRAGFSLVELLLAIFILGIGVISIAALFPAGIAQQRRSVDEVMGPIVAGNAMSILRTKLQQSYFGTFELFDDNGVPFSPDPTIRGDWPWLRPGFIFEDDPATDEINENGAIDIFSHEFWSGATLESASEFPSAFTDDFGITAADPVAGDLVGLPYAPDRFTTGPPRILVSQSERAFPMYANGSLDADRARPEYFWECLFRRFEGKIHVAVFVYRVSYPPAFRATYAVPRNPGGGSNPDQSPLPLVVELSTTNGGYWDSYGPDAANSGDDAVIPGTDPGSAFDPTNQGEQWQYPRQWLLDQNNNIHRTLAGRQATIDGPVELNRPVAEMPPYGIYRLFAASDTAYNAGSPLNGLADTDVVEKIFFMPVRIELDTNADGTPETPVTLAPVYVMVEEL